MKSLRIAIATAGRFHVLDLARELDALGHEVRFYSYVPAGRAGQFGLPDRCRVSLLPFAAPFLLWERLAPGLWPRARERLFQAALDRAVQAILRPCDLFIGMSGLYVAAARGARARFGAQIWVERGSRHIQSQDEILAVIAGAERPSPNAIRREAESYRLADRIVIPSRHVEDSFRRDPAAQRKLFRNPYGVALAMFPQAPPRPAGGRLELIYVGGWSLRKGCDLLTAAIRAVDGVRLTHVGPLGDLAFPAGDARFVHVAPVSQDQLGGYYQQADVFVLASREEGLSLVLAQALAGGLPVICTDRTGGEDLAWTPALADRISVVPTDDPAALAAAIETARDRALAGGPPRLLSESDRETLSWAAYGRRYNDEIARARDLTR